jgi:cytochrome c-type biogenesis protein CcmH/NrfG
MFYRYVVIFVIIILWLGCSISRKKTNTIASHATAAFHRVIIPGGAPQTRDDLVALRTHLRERLHTHSTQLNCWVSLGQVGIALNDFDTASEAFASAYQLDPKNVVARLGYAEVLAHSADPIKNHQAQQLLNNFIIISPDKMESLNMQAMRAIQQCLTQKAIIAWRIMSHFELFAGSSQLIIDNLILIKRVLTLLPLKYEIPPPADTPCIPTHPAIHQKKLK